MLLPLWSLLLTGWDGGNGVAPQVMPVMDGVAATQRIREIGHSFASLPIIALTANAMPEDRQNCTRVGMNGFLCKPFIRADIIRLIQQVLFTRNNNAAGGR